ncbi:MAG TPA: Tol-Pal system beta propeller repeat protein TolB [Pseudomonadales bacterium]|nr:Tol-Pal system beta propeller repeat protein TolB [Pseudomonadales bacterium]
MNIRAIAALAALTCALTAHAQITIEIDRGYDNPKKIAVVPFGVGAGVQGLDNPSDIISFDLARTGQFAPTPAKNMLSMPDQPKEVLFRDWRVLGDEYVVIGRVDPASNGNISVSYFLFDVLNERQLANGTFTAPPTALRDMAHLASDEIYEKLTGIRGAFSTRIIYVLAFDLSLKTERYRLEMADADGARPRTLLESKEPILSATWSPDGKNVAYVSFEKGKPCIIMQEIASGARTVLTDFPGLNSAPAFSPDGKQLALVLSKDGDPEIYTMNLATRELRRITRQRGADTEPSWTADGKSLVFTSDRGGKPQIYQIEIATGLTQRLTFEGDYNARARMLPDGKHMVFVHRNDGVFHIAVMDLDKGRLMALTSTSLDESPSIAPNGTMLIYATQDKGRGILAVVSIDGSVKYRLPSSVGDVREPAWSPFLNRTR